jgi:hypothetical protein
LNQIFEVSINKRDSDGSRWCPTAYTTQQKSCQKIDRFLEKKILLIHFGDSKRNIFQHLGGEDITLLLWKLRFQLYFRQIQITDRGVKISVC